MSPALSDESTGVGNADRIRSEAMEPSKNVRAGGGKMGALSQGATRAKYKNEPGVNEKGL